MWWHRLGAMRIEPGSDRMILPGGGSSAGGRRRGRGGRGRGGRSRERSLSAASTFFICQSAGCVIEQSRRASHLILHENSSEAVEELEWRNDMTLN